uniref:ArsR family transcription regulator n=2 Tax=Thermococcus sp. AMT11 TaxID=563043 RepID=C8BND2_9EURY|nr:ArsR family transcription regulator [Thermococcus sp. AMT11]
MMVGEDTALALKKLESALTKNAHVRTQILTLLMSHPDGLTFKEIKETLKKSDESINQALQALILLGYVEKLGKQYKLKPGVRDGIFRVLWAASDELIMEMRRKGL